MPHLMPIHSEIDTRCADVWDDIEFHLVTMFVGILEHLADRIIISSAEFVADIIHVQLLRRPKIPTPDKLGLPLPI